MISIPGQLLLGNTNRQTGLKNRMENRIEKWNGKLKSCIKPILI